MTIVLQVMRIVSELSLQQIQALIFLTNPQDPPIEEILYLEAGKSDYTA